MRLLLTWLQIHPAIGAAGRIQVGAQQAVDAENFEVGRRWEPDTDLEREAVDAAMAASPPRSVDDLLALMAREVEKVAGVHVGVHAVRPVPEPEAVEE